MDFGCTYSHLVLNKLVLLPEHCWNWTFFVQFTFSSPFGYFLASWNECERNLVYFWPNERELNSNFLFLFWNLQYAFGNFHKKRSKIFFNNVVWAFIWLKHIFLSKILGVWSFFWQFARVGNELNIFSSVSIQFMNGTQVTFCQRNVKWT